MPSFRPVDGDRAGPDAVGILVPPGQRTLVVVRPRSLAWDLVLARRVGGGGPGPGFLEMPRPEARFIVQKLEQKLVWSAEDGSGRAEPVPAPQGEGYWVWIDLEPHPLVACDRSPGLAYRPSVFANLAEAWQTASAISAVLCPGPDANLELYTNTDQFQR